MAEMPRYGRWMQTRSKRWWCRPQGESAWTPLPFGLRPPFRTTVLSAEQEGLVRCDCRMVRWANPVSGESAVLCPMHESNPAEGVRIALRRDPSAVRRHFQIRGSE